MDKKAFHKKKKFGQHFLTSDQVPRRMISGSDIDKNCGVLEIGPGLGILTAELLNVAGKVVSVEIDDELIPILNKRFDGNEQFKLIKDDILKIDLSVLIREEFQDMPVCVCANLPYYITTPIVMTLLESELPFSSITVMVQKEVASRLCAAKGSPEYGAVTVAVNYYSSVKRLFIVPAGAFSPPPKVDSAVIIFRPHGANIRRASDEKLFFDIVKSAFSQRRKTLLNALYPLFSERFSKEMLSSLLDCQGFSGQTRGECLSVDDFMRIVDKINKYK